tara:strand:+ start:97 stop:747 length:651 start_codon:yes stop_codon:yes gene_type:complete
MSEKEPDNEIYDDVDEVESQNDSINDDNDDLSVMSELNDELDDDHDNDMEELELPDEENYEDDEVEPQVIDVNYSGDDDDDYDDDDDDDYEGKFQKFENLNIDNYINQNYLHLKENNIEEIKVLSKVIRDKDNNIIDDLHKTLPILTKYEKARIIGVRASQINSGAKILVKTHKSTFDGYIIAEQELYENKIPFIIKRPLPTGKCEYWKIQDLEII